MLLKYILVCLVAYGLGNFATSFVVGKLSAGIDIRKHGSGNAGATNTFRVLGLKMALLTFLGDAIKGAIAVGIGHYVLGETGEYVAGIFVVLGHIWPAVLGFKGGKGVATTIGVMLSITPLYVLLLAPVWFLLVGFTKYVSLGSITGMFFLPILMILRGEPRNLVLFGALIAAMSIFAHRSNLKKLLTGKESKIDLKKKKKQENSEVEKKSE